MSRAVGNGALDTLSKAISSGKINENAADIQGIMGVTYGDDADAVHLVEKSGDNYNSPALIEIHRQITDLQASEKTSGLMFNPETGKLHIPCGNGVTVNKATGMLEVPIGEHLRYTDSGLDVPDAGETTAGVVKLTHEVSNRDDGEWAITADGVYSYCPAKDMAVELPHANMPLLTPPPGFTHLGGIVTCTKNNVLCTTGTVWYIGNKPEGMGLNDLKWTNNTGISIPIITFLNNLPNEYCTAINPDGHINASGDANAAYKVTVLIPPMIVPFKTKE